MFVAVVMCIVLLSLLCLAQTNSVTQGKYVYVLDSGHERVEVFSRKGTSEAQFSHSFASPSGITLDANNNVYVKDGNHCDVDKFDSHGNYLLHFGFCATHGEGLGIFDNTGQIAADASGNEWVTSPDYYYMQKVDSNGNFLSIICMEDTGVPNCPMTTPAPVQPYGITIDATGNIYVTNVYPNSYYVVKFDSSGTFLSTFGNGSFEYPGGIAIGSGGDIYVVDYGENQVVRFDSNGVYKSRFGSYGSGDGQFIGPVGIAIDAAGELFVADVGNSRIEEFNADGVYLSQKQGSNKESFLYPAGVALSH
jgi:DNA-binding beta-propeller fold protein YncE